MSCCPCVVTSSGTIKIVERFGKFVRIARPGLSCNLPFIDCISGTISMRLQQMEVSCETKSKDNVRARRAASQTPDSQVARSLRGEAV